MTSDRTGEAICRACGRTFEYGHTAAGADARYCLRAECRALHGARMAAAEVALLAKEDGVPHRAAQRGILAVFEAAGLRAGTAQAEALVTYLEVFADYPPVDAQF